MGTISGLLWAKSPLFTLNKVNGFMSALKIYDDSLNTAYLAIITMSDDQEKLKTIYEAFALNEYIRLNGCKVTKIGIENGSKRYTILFRADKADCNIQKLDESDLSILPPKFKCCILKGPLLDYISYIGTVTKIVSRDSIILDSNILVIGLSNLKVGQTLSLTNIFSASRATGLTQLISETFSVQQNSVYIFCPAFSSIAIDEKYLLMDCPALHSNFMFRYFQKNLVEKLECQKKAVLVSDYLCPVRNIAVLFLSIADGNSQYFDELNLSNVSEIRNESSNIDKPHEGLLALNTTQCRYPIVGNFSHCPVTGLTYFGDRTDSILVHPQQEISLDRLVIITQAYLHRETYLLDSIAGIMASRIWLAITKWDYLESEKTQVAKELKIPPEFYLVLIETLSPPHLYRSKPISMQSSVRGYAMCSGRSTGNEIELMAMKKSAEVHLTAAQFYQYQPEPGKYCIATSAKNGIGLQFFSLINVDVDPALLKGIAKFLELRLLVSKCVYNHLQKHEIPSRFFDISENERTYIGNQEFRGVIESINIEGTKTSSHPLFLRLFKSYSIGSPINNSRLVISIHDMRYSSRKIVVEFDLVNSKLMPTGLIPGALIHGSGFHYSKERLISTAESHIRVESLLNDLQFHSYEDDESLESAPFHYFSDFFGYHTQDPMKKLTVRFYVNCIIQLNIWALCSSCSSEVQAENCPIHGKLGAEDVNIHAWLHLSVTDGTTEAEVICKEFSMILSVLEIMAIKESVTKWTIKAGKLDFKKLQALAQLDLDHIMLNRYQIKGICTEAIKHPKDSGNLVSRKFVAGKQVYQALTFPGKIVVEMMDCIILEDTVITKLLLDVFESK